MDPITLARLALLSAILAVSANTGAPSAPQISATNTTTYIVQAGDTLFSIATKFNTTVAALQQANNITNPNSLAVGQRLIIPGVVAQNVVTPSPSSGSGQVPTARGPTPSSSSVPRTPAPVTSDVETYIVRAGDTLASIAAQFGITLEELKRVNNISNPNVLNVGQRLIIPKVSAAQYLPEGIALDPQVVRQGQTVTIQVMTPGASQVLGKFDQQELKFNRVGETWIALTGISRCANYVGNFPVSLTVRDSLGNPRQVQFDVRVNPTNFTLANLTLTPGMSALLDPAIMNAENNLVARTVSAYTPGQMWNGKFHPPLDVKNPRISSYFGERRSYNGGKPGICGHEGQDFAVDGGTPVHAPADGVVMLASPLKVRGNVVFLDHGRGVFSGFFHLSAIDVKQGQRVKAGDLVGKVGTTGFSTGDHLHWSMWVNGIYVDPIQWTEEEIP